VTVEDIVEELLPATSTNPNKATTAARRRTDHASPNPMNER
jgi:hypothetical protein